MRHKFRISVQVKIEITWTLIQRPSSQTSVSEIY